MAILEKQKWLSSDTYDFERNEEGVIFAVKSEPGSATRIVREEMPEGSFTKFLREKLI